jgi:hypothetical protein
MHAIQLWLQVQKIERVDESLRKLVAAYEHVHPLTGRWIRLSVASLSDGLLKLMNLNVVHSRFVRSFEMAKMETDRFPPCVVARGKRFMTPSFEPTLEETWYYETAEGKATTEQTPRRRWNYRILAQPNPLQVINVRDLDQRQQRLLSFCTFLWYHTHCWFTTVVVSKTPTTVHYTLGDMYWEGQEIWVPTAQRQAWVTIQYYCRSLCSAAGVETLAKTLANPYEQWKTSPPPGGTHRIIKLNEILA